MEERIRLLKEVEEEIRSCKECKKND